MNLATATTSALDLTRSMQQALDQNDVEKALEILPARGLAMERLQAAHRNATGAEQESCRELLQALKELDADLQHEAGARLEEAARSLHQASGGGATRTEQNTCLSSCLDRHA